MNLSMDQKQALQQGNAVPVVVETTDCVLLRRDIFDRVKALLYDDSEWTHDDLRKQLARSYEGSGWDEPEMDAYDNYDSSCQ